MIVWKILRLLLCAGVKPLQTILLATTKWHTSSMRCQSQGWLYFMYVMLAGYWWLLPSLSLPCPSWQAGSTIEWQKEDLRQILTSSPWDWQRMLLVCHFVVAKNMVWTLWSVTVNLHLVERPLSLSVTLYSIISCHMTWILPNSATIHICPP